MTNATFGIRGIAPFAGATQSRKQFQNRGGERTLGKHADAIENSDESEQPLSLEPGRVLDIKI